MSIPIGPTQLGDPADLKQQWAKTLPSPADWASGDPSLTWRPPADATVIAPLATAAPDPGRPAFDFIEEIGRGGMGVVWRARQGSLQREVAVKQILPDVKDPDVEAMFVSEALVTGSLDHPNIVPVHELARTGTGQVLLAMKLVSGRPWARLLHPTSDEEKKAAAAYDTQRHIGVLLAVSNAVGFAHSKAIVHRDLKPENVMVGEYGEVLVMDWGLAVDVSDPPGGSAPRSAPPSTRAPHKSAIHAPAGTPSYMPPELAQGRGDRIGPWTDTYLLGAMLHEVVTGHAPHRGTTLAEVLRAAVRSAAPEYAADVPSELQGILRKAMWQQPEARYQTVQELREAVEGYLRHRESALISKAAEGALARCQGEAKGAERNRLYAAYAEAVAGFKQARLLWAENAEAIEGERRARLAYAGAALAQGDLGLAEAQVLALDAPDVVGDADGAALRKRIEEARAAQDRAARSTRVLRRSLVGATAVIVVGLVAGIVLVKAEQRRTLAEKARAVDRLAESYVLRARQCAALGDDAAAAVYYAEACVVRPTHLTRACATLALRRLCPLRAILPHEDEVFRVAFSPDGARVATASFDTTARVWDGATGAPVARVRWPDGEMRTVAFSPDGRRIATGAYTCGQLWDAATGKAIGPPLDHTETVDCVAFSPDGERLVTASRDYTARLWDGRTGAPLGRAMEHAGVVNQAAFSPDGTRVLTASQDGTARLWDAKTGAPIGREMRHEGVVCRASFSRDGERVVTASADGTARLWDARTGEPAGKVLHHADAVVAAVFSPDGTRVLTAGDDRTARLWDAATGEPHGRVMRHNAGVNDAAFTPDGRWVATASADGMARLWDADGEPLGGMMRHGGKVYCVAVSPDGRRIATASEDRTARVWDAGTDRPRCAIHHYKGWIQALVFLPDGTCVASETDAKQQVHSWDARTGRALRREDLPPVWDPAGRVSPDGRRKVKDVPPRSVQVVDAETGAPIGRAMPHGGRVSAAAFSPDGRLLLTGSEDREARLWDAGTGEPLARPMPHGGVVQAVAFSPDGRTLATGSWDATVRLWDAETCEPLEEPLLQDAPVRQVAFSPDGRWLAAADADPMRPLHAVRFWDIAAIEDASPAEEVRLRAQADSGYRLNGAGDLEVIPSDEWRPLGSH